MFHVLQCFLSYSNSYSVFVTFLTFFRFLAIFQILQCAHLIFHFFSVSHNIQVPKVCVSLFPNLPVSLPILHILQIVFFPHGFQCFLPYSLSYSVHFSFSMFFRVSCHSLCPTVCVSHFPHCSVFLVIFQFLKCVRHIFDIFQVSSHIPILQCAYFIFHDFQSFSPYSSSYSFCFSVSTFLSVSPHIPDLEYVFLIYPVGQFFSPYSRSYRVSF